jgi:cation transport ATPase
MNTRPLALFSVADTIKESSREAIADLHRLGVRTMMLTGDNQHTAEAIARSVGIDEVRAGLLPEDKLSIIRSLQGNGGTVGMVGDGINDAPALARADVGFAMGAAGTTLPHHFGDSQAEHNPGTGDQGGFPRAHNYGSRHHVDGRIRRHGSEYDCGC